MLGWHSSLGLTSCFEDSWTGCPQSDQHIAWNLYVVAQLFYHTGASYNFFSPFLTSKRNKWNDNLYYMKNTHFANFTNLQDTHSKLSNETLTLECRMHMASPSSLFTNWYNFVCWYINFALKPFINSYVNSKCINL